MSSLRNTVVEKLNDFINSNKEVKESARFNLYQFDNHFNTVIEDCDIQEVKHFTLEDFVPRGGTRLIDAGCKYIDEIGSRLAKMKTEDRPQQVIVVFITDGEENASTKYSMEQFTERISIQRNMYSWQFVFIGTNEEGMKTGHNYSQSIGVNNMLDENVRLRYGAAPQQMMASSFDYLSQGLRSLRSMKVASVDNFTKLATAQSEK
jgi:uncharacterized protein YegL